MGVIVISRDITESNVWKKENLYVINGFVSVLTGVKLTIESGTKIGFLFNPNQFSTIRFASGSELDAGTFCAFPVDQKYQKTSYSLNLAARINIRSFLFEGSNKVSPPTQKTKIVINKLCCSNLGGKIIFDSLSVDEVFINEINCDNSPISFTRSSMKIEKIKNINSRNGLESLESNLIFGEVHLENLNIGILTSKDSLQFDKLIINKTNYTFYNDKDSTNIIVKKEICLCAFSLFYDLFETSDILLTISESAKLNIQGILINNINIETSDPNIPNTKPYAVPYKASSKRLSGSVIFKSNKTEPVIPPVIPEKEGYKIITGKITEDTVWVNSIIYVIRGTVSVVGKLTIEDKTKVLFFPYSFLNFSSTSQLFAGNITSYPVTFNFCRINRYTRGGWQFIGSANPSNITFTKLSIDSLYLNYFSGISSNTGKIGSLYLTNSDFQWVASIVMDSVYADKTYLQIGGENNIINTLSIKNNVYGIGYCLFGNKTSINVKDLEISNVGYGTLRFADLKFSCNVSNKNFVKANDILFQETKINENFKLLTNKNAAVDLNGTLFDSFDVKSEDTRIPQTKPYSVPYIAKVENLTAELSIDALVPVAKRNKSFFRLSEKNVPSKPHLCEINENLIFYKL